MAETIVDKQVCSNCGSDVRENTQFCYNCGESVVLSNNNGPEVAARASTTDASSAKEPELSEVGARSKAALEDLAEKLKADEASADEKLAKAAEERKKARVERRRAKDYRWEPVDDSSMLGLLLKALLVVLLVAAIVVTAIWLR